MSLDSYDVAKKSYIYGYDTEVTERQNARHEKATVFFSSCGADVAGATDFNHFHFQKYFSGKFK